MSKGRLIPNSARTPQELKEMTTKGGIASGKARREKAELKKLFMQFAEMKPSPKESAQLKAMGFEENNLTNLTAFVVSMFKNGAKGNSKALELSYDLLINNNKKELEIKKLEEEIERVKLENEKLRKEINQSDNEKEMQEQLSKFEIEFIDGSVDNGTTDGS